MEDRPGKIFVGGLDFDIDEAEFEKIFAKFGKITEVLLKRDQQSGKSRGFGFITYENPSDADDAVKAVDKQDIKGKMVHVDHAVKPGGSSGGGADRGRGGFRGRGAPRGRGFGSFRDSGRGGSSFSSRGGGFRGRGAPRGGDRGRGGFGGRGRGSDRPMRGSYGDDRRGLPPPQRRSSLDRGYGDRGPPTMRRDEDRYGGMDRDRYGSSSLSDRRTRDPYPPSPPRGLDRDPVSSYRDYGLSSRDYSPPRERVSSRDYLSSRDLTVTRSSYDTGRDSYTSRDPYTSSSSSRRDDYLPPRETRDDYLSPRDSRDYTSSREPPRDYIPRETTRTISRDYERMSSRDTYDTYRDRMPTSLSRGYMSGSPPRSRSPLPTSRSTYSPPPRSAPIVRDIERDRGRSGDYSLATRRPATYDSRDPPPVKRSRVDDLPPSRGLPSRDVQLSRGPPSRDGLTRGLSREAPRDSARVPPRGPPRDGGRGGPPPSFRR